MSESDPIDEEVALVVDFDDWQKEIDDELYGLYEVVLADVSDYPFQDWFEQSMSVDDVVDFIAVAEELK